MSLRGILSLKWGLSRRPTGLFAVALSLTLAASLYYANPSQAMVDYDTEALEETASLFGYGDRDEGGRGGGYGGDNGYYFNIFAPITYAFKAVSYALRIPLYAAKTAYHIIQVPLSFLAHREGYES